MVFAAVQAELRQDSQEGQDTQEAPEGHEEEGHADSPELGERHPSMIIAVGSARIVVGGWIDPRRIVGGAAAAKRFHGEG